MSSEVDRYRSVRCDWRIAASAWLILACAAGVRPAFAEPAGPAAPGDAGVSLEALLRVAERRSPSLVLARERERQARRWREAVPGALHDPTLGIEAGPRFASGGSETDYDVALSLSQPIEIAGEGGLRREAGDRRSKRAIAESSLARWQLRRALLLAYRRAQVASEQVRLGDRATAFSDELRKIADRRRTLGEGSVIEVRIAEADAAEARRARSLAEQQLRTARIELGELSGWPGEVAPVPSEPLGAAPPLPELEAVLTRLSAEHPEFVATRRRVEEAVAEHALRAREGFPVPVFGAEFAREGSPAGTPNYLILGSLSLPLPLFRANREERARALGEELVLRAESQTTTAQVRARVRLAHAELSGALERLNLLSAAARSFEDGLGLLERGFSAGEIELLNVTVARERWFNALSGALEARLECERAFVELEAAAGRELEHVASKGARP